LHETCTVSTPLWSELAGRYSEQQMLELVIVAGWYRLLSGVINALGIQLEPWAARFPGQP
jgi:alkylhydroperoxidase family enzyme